MDTNAFYRDTWAEIDLTAIKHNVSHMKDHIGQSVQLMAVVKANAYGHGEKWQKLPSKQEQTY